jgi:hypothetical protein
MIEYRRQVRSALAAVEIRGPAQYAWLGRRSRRLGPAVIADMGPVELRRYLVQSLRDELYFSFYCHGQPVPARWGEPQPVGPDPWLLDAMSRANAGRGGREGGWTVDRVSDGHAVVSRDGLRVRVPRGADMSPGAAVSLPMPKELPAFSPGYWTALGDAAAGDSRSGDVRVYWHVTAAGAPALVGALTTRLNDEAVPFRLKVADHPFRLDRCDAAVLYLEATDFTRVRARLGELAAALAPHLRPRIPAFTLALAPGVGLAEDDDGESFGVRRCALLADGIVRAHEQELDGLDAVVARFAEAGVAIEAPYRDPSLAGRHVL